MKAEHAKKGDRICWIVGGKTAGPCIVKGFDGGQMLVKFSNGFSSLVPIESPIFIMKEADNQMRLELEG